MEFDILNPAPGMAFDKEGNVVEKTTDAEIDTPAQAAAAPDPSQEARPSQPMEINWEEKTGGKFKSWEDIEARLNTEVSPEPVTFANEEAKKVYELLKDGKVDDVLQVYNEQRRLSNLDKMSPDDMIKLAWEYKNTGLDARDIEEEFEAKYSVEKPEAPVEDDYIDDDAYAAAKKQYDKAMVKYEKELKAVERRKKIDAAEAKETLSSYKKDITLPDIPQASTADQIDPAEEARSLEEYKKNRNEYLTSLEKSAESFNEIAFKVSDEGVNFEGSFQIDKEELAQLKKDLTEKDVVNDILLPRYVKGDGFDTKQLLEDVYYLRNREKITSAAIKQAVAKEKLNILAETKNVNLNDSPREAFVPSTEAKIEEFGNKFFGI